MFKDWRIGNLGFVAPKLTNTNILELSSQTELNENLELVAPKIDQCESFGIALQN